MIANSGLDHASRPKVPSFRSLASKDVPSVAAASEEP